MLVSGNFTEHGRHSITARMNLYRPKLIRQFAVRHEIRYSSDPFNMPVASAFPFSHCSLEYPKCRSRSRSLFDCFIQHLSYEVRQRVAFSFRGSLQPLSVLGSESQIDSAGLCLTFGHLGATHGAGLQFSRHSRLSLLPPLLPLQPVAGRSQEIDGAPQRAGRGRCLFCVTTRKPCPCADDREGQILLPLRPKWFDRSRLLSQAQIHGALHAHRVGHK